MKTRAYTDFVPLALGRPQPSPAQLSPTQPSLSQPQLQTPQHSPRQAPPSRLDRSAEAAADLPRPLATSTSKSHQPSPAQPSPVQLWLESQLDDRLATIGSLRLPDEVSPSRASVRSQQLLCVVLKSFNTYFPGFRLYRRNIGPNI